MNFRNTVCMNKTEPAVDVVNRLALELPHIHSVRAIIDLVVEHTVNMPGVAAAEVWLSSPEDLCLTCQDKEEQSASLHLVAISTKKRQNNIVPQKHARHLSETDFLFGKAMTVGQTHTVKDLQKNKQWCRANQWIKRLGIVGLVTEPLSFRDLRLGAMVLYFRESYRRQRLKWVKIVAGHTASSIVNARAFFQIGKLHDKLRSENEYLRAAVQDAHSFGEIVGCSPALKRVLQQITLVAPTDASVLITGESGTGKELVAREIHRLSARRDEPIITVNCASVPRELYESEFFGHVKGAFTGATSNRVGRFEMADGGTLFLDEVGEIPLKLQSKLLRVLQEGSYERVGDGRTRKVNVRVVSATNRDLVAESAAGRFRQDLFYRLNVFPVEIPPLRNRKEDIPMLARHFLAISAKRLRRPLLRLSKKNVQMLKNYSWPGNVRELENVIERAVITSLGKELRLYLPEETSADDIVEADLLVPNSKKIMTEQEIRTLEKENLMAILEMTRWRVSGAGGAAEILGVNPSTLASRMRKWGIKR